MKETFGHPTDLGQCGFFVGNRSRIHAAAAGSLRPITRGCPEGFLSVPAECNPKPKGIVWRTLEQKLEQLKCVEARALADSGAMLANIKRSPGHNRACSLLTIALRTAVGRFAKGL